jgi:hypothetical protein
MILTIKIKILSYIFHNLWIINDNPLIPPDARLLGDKNKLKENATKNSPAIKFK